MATRTAEVGKKTPQRGGHRLDITVWQFVRIMVQFEALAKSRGGRRRGGQTAQPQERPVYGDWRTAWQEIDRELTRLAANDSEAFSDLMMNQNVVLECRNRTQINEVTRAITNIVHQMRAEVAASAGDDEHITDLRFEIRELEKLSRTLSGVGRKKGAKPTAAKPATAKPATAKPGEAAGAVAKSAGKPAAPSTTAKSTRRPADKSASAKATTARAGAGKAGAGKTGRPKPGVGKIGAGKSASTRPAGARPAAAKPKSAKPTAAKPTGSKPTGAGAPARGARSRTGAPLKPNARSRDKRP